MPFLGLKHAKLALREIALLSDHTNFHHVYPLSKISGETGSILSPPKHASLPNRPSKFSLQIGVKFSRFSPKDVLNPTSYIITQFGLKSKTEIFFCSRKWNSDVTPFLSDPHFGVLDPLRGSWGGAWCSWCTFPPPLFPWLSRTEFFSLFELSSPMIPN